MLLTRTQLKVVALVAEGLPNKLIAHKLGVEEATVKVHVTGAKARLGLSNRVQLAVWYVKRDLDSASSLSAVR